EPAQSVLLIFRRDVALGDDCRPPDGGVADAGPNAVVKLSHLVSQIPQQAAPRGVMRNVWRARGCGALPQPSVPPHPQERRGTASRGSGDVRARPAPRATRPTRTRVWHA